MKKKVFSVENMLKLTNAKHAIENALKEGKAQELAAALNEALDTIQNAEEEVDETELKTKIEEVIATVLKDAEPNAKTNEAIANAIAKRMAAVQNSIDKSLPVEVRNGICAAILRCSGKDEVRNAVNGILTKNGITGMSFEKSVDYTIVENWGDLNPIFRLFKRVDFSKFFYSDQDMKNANILAKQWAKTATGEKKVQEIVATAKEISTAYVYKRQKFANEDIDEIEKAGQASNFLKFINEELDRMIVNTIVMAVLIGDGVNGDGEKLTKFEAIGSKSASDVFTYIGHPATVGAPNIKDVRTVADKVKNPEMKKKVAIMSSEFLTAISEFIYAAGGTTMYRTRAEIAEQIGVDEILTCDLVDPDEGMFCIVMLDQAYWYQEKKTVAVSFPKWEENVVNYLKERNVGGAIHDLHCTGVLKAATE